MSLPPLLGRRIHISGSIAKDPTVATPEAVASARQFVETLVTVLVRDGASFVVPIDGEPTRSDGLPICFDWLILEAIDKNLRARPAAASRDGLPLVYAVQHYKNEAQIPVERLDLWNGLKEMDGLVMIENAGRWNMASKRMDIQASLGDVLITLGGDEGVHYLANLYHDAGKPVIPLNFPLTGENQGSLRLWDRALTGSETDRFFRTSDGSSAHNLINRLHFTERTPVEKKVAEVQHVLHALRKPVVFAVRLLNPDHVDYHDVDDFFSAVVRPIVEEFGYELKTMGEKVSEEALVNQEIFNYLYYSSIVVTDVTGLRPNCFLELGFALGRGRPVMVNARKGTSLPFDISPVPTNLWDTAQTIAERQSQFRTYWKANINRRPIVAPSLLVP